jgi:nucleoside-diphosphate-sugar epimerase
MIPNFAISGGLPPFGICSIGWPTASSTGRRLEPYIFRLRLITKTCALVSRSIAEQSAAFLPWGDGDAVIPLAGAEDVARVAATLLASSSAPSEKLYPLVSETPTVRQIVETLGKAIGRPIRYVPITDDQWADAVKERLNPHALDHLSHLWHYFRNSKEGRQATMRFVRSPARIHKLWKSSSERMSSLSSPKVNQFVSRPDPRKI